MKIRGKFKLSDQRLIKDDECEKAKLTFSAIAELLKNREAEIEARGNADIGYPDNNWKQKDNPNKLNPIKFYQFLNSLSSEEPSPQLLNTFRFFTGHFSGRPLLGKEWTYENYLDKYQHFSLQEFDRLIVEKGVLYDCISQIKQFSQITRQLPHDLVMTPPNIMGEIGWLIDKSVVNYDTFAHQERVTLLYESGIINWLREKVREKGAIHILEIGGGYGGLAYFLKRLFPTAKYTMVDLPESLLFASCYLRIASPDVPHDIYLGRERERAPA